MDGGLFRMDECDGGGIHKTKREVSTSEYSYILGTWKQKDNTYYQDGYSDQEFVDVSGPPIQFVIVSQLGWRLILLDFRGWPWGRQRQCCNHAVGGQWDVRPPSYIQWSLRMGWGNRIWHFSFLLLPWHNHWFFAVGGLKVCVPIVDEFVLMFANGKASDKDSGSFQREVEYQRSISGKVLGY